MIQRRTTEALPGNNHIQHIFLHNVFLIVCRLLLKQFMNNTSTDSTKLKIFIKTYPNECKRDFTINTFLLFCQIMVELKWRGLKGFHCISNFLMGDQRCSRFFFTKKLWIGIFFFRKETFSINCWDFFLTNPKRNFMKWLPPPSKFPSPWFLTICIESL